FLALNPSYNRPIIASRDGNLEILLPIASAQTFRDNLSAYNKPLVTWRTYTAKRGERIDSIASKFGVGTEQIRTANNLSSNDVLSKSATILVPKSNQNSDSPSQAGDEKTNATDSINLLVKQSSGNIDLALPETQAIINTENETEAKSDTKDKPAVKSKQEIKEKKAEPVKPTSFTHTVKKGETLQSIAKQYDVSVKQILAVNTFKSTKVKLGQSINIKKNVERKEMKSKSAEKSDDKSHKEQNKNVNKVKVEIKKDKQRKSSKVVDKTDKNKVTVKHNNKETKSKAKKK
ncbi:MAG: LysM peptidoglycan-binding domain-containing protein, partial [Methylophilaceae bacterium]